MDPNHVITPCDYTIFSHHVPCGGNRTVFILTEEEEEEACEENMHAWGHHTHQHMLNITMETGIFLQRLESLSFFLLSSEGSHACEMIHKHTYTTTTKQQLAKPLPVGKSSWITADLHFFFQHMHNHLWKVQEVVGKLLAQIPTGYPWSSD